MSVEAWQDFGQKVDLTARIREILLNYPEGTSILKELVQNADDARATCIKFCLDCRQHGTRSLLSPAMAPFQGPALLAFNDGVFSDRDLESISRIGDSKKKDEEGKTGRFGVGFNSCYHLTDVPSFVSGRHLVIFDPHCRHLPNISSTNPGKRIDFVQYGDVAAQYADQVAPYAGAFGCTLGAGGGGAVSGGGSGSLGPWSGTLFRFPLRSAELAEASTISKQIYTIESIRTLLEQLATESFQILLFLKHISRVEIHEWAPDAAAPHILFSCYVSNLSREVAWERGLFARVSRDRPSQQNVDQAASGGGGIRVPLPEVLASYRLELLREWHDGGGGIGAVVRRPERRSYIISQMRGGGEAAEMAEQLSKLFGAVVAWGAVAADVTTVAGAAGGGGDAAAAAAAGQLEDGRAFCFLPLPIRTGLPVHVNGYFELSSNRRDIWYGEDMTGSGARRAQWNIQLLLRVIAPAYVAALTAAAAVLGHGEAYDRLWPAADVAQPWQSLLEEFFRRVADMALCWSTIRGGCWVAPRSGVLRDQVVAASPPLAAALVEVAELPLLELPPGVGQLMLRHMAPKPRVCSPALARQALLAAAKRAAVSEPSADAALRAHAPLLLDYCLSDLMPYITATPTPSLSPVAASGALWSPPSPASAVGATPTGATAAAAAAAGPQAAQAAAQLVGLRLLPLLDGTTATLCAAVPGGKQHPQTQQQSSPQHRGGHPAAPYPSCFLPTAEECTLLARAGGLLVDANELSPTGRSKLEALAAARVLNFAKLDSLAMAAVVLPQLLPPAWLPARAVGGAAAGGRVVDWEIDPAGQAAGVDREWLQLLWRWLATHGSLPCFVGLPLLPILGGRLAPFADAASSISVLPPAEVVQRAAAGAGGRVVSTADGGVGAAADRAAQLAELLTQLGLQIVDLETFPDLPVSELLRGGHVHRCDGPGILAALQRLSAATHHPQAGRTTQAPVPQPAGGGPPIDGVGEQPASDGNGRGRPVLSAGLAARVTALAAADKHLLRSILLTEDCLTALTASGPSRSATSAGKPALPQAEARGLLQLLAALPIYESAKGAGAAATAAAAAGSSGGSGLQAAEPVFMALHGSGGTCFLAPHGVDVRVLGSLHGSIFVVAASEAEGRLMVTYLGVRAITAAEAFRHHVLPGLVLLPGELRNATVLDMLRGLPQLSAQDRGFGAWLAQVPFVPNNKGELHTPGELYDPRNPDLAALLDPEADFPAASLLLQAAGSASSAATNGGGSTGNGGEASGGAPAAAAASSTDEDGAGDASLVLYMLQQLGLRTAATLDTLLQAARFVERIADAAAAAAVAATTATAAAADAPERPSAPQAPPVAASTTSAAAEDSDMAVARGKALLAYLEAEAGRIMGPVGASPAPAMSASVGAAGTTGAAGAGSGGGSGLGTGGGARRFAAGLFSKARELFGQGTQEQPAVAEVHNFWQELARIRWCPVLQDPPAPGLPWPARHAVPRLAAPRTIRPPSDMWLCSSCMFLVDGECRSSALAAGLGWSGRLGGSVLAQQLLQLGEMHTQVTDPALSQVLAGVVPLLYRSLAELGLHEAPVARGLLYGSRCVWVGNGFAPAGKVAFKGSLDLSPWLYVMPAELAPFKDLLLSYGAADGFSAVQYCSVLQDMAEATGAVGSASVSAATAAAAASSSPALPPPPPPPQPLMEVQLGQVVAVAQALADLTLPAGAIIYLPDERGVLARAGDLAFNDAPWLAGQPSAASVRLVHPRISAHVAARLGTPSLRRLLLAASADCMALGTVGGAEAFGQSEALTTRLRHIIADYPEGPGVLMELLQNADDAGATSLELLLDDTTYPASSILSPAMAVWQGPALLVANDAVFSPADFANISRIGQDSKASRPTSIGRFGLGFNAVYHFTDLPCFVSGDYLVMFDPHAKYLPGVSAAQPGLKIAFARAQLLQQFPDAFTPFTHLGCNMQERFMGTLFRFPLRGPAAAAASDIKTTPCSPEDVAALLESFRRQLPAALLFLKNIRLVTAYYRSAPSPPAADSGGEACLQLLFRASREMVPPAGAAETASLAAGGDGGAEAAALQLSVSELSGAGEQNGLLQSAITRFIAGSASDPSDLASFYKRLANTSATGLPSEMGLMQLQMETNLTLPPGGIAAVASGGGGAASATSASSAAEASSKPGHRAVPGMVTERWLVCNALGGGGARDMALKSFRNHSTKMVPWVGVAARVPSAVGGAVGGEVLATAKGDAGGDDSGGGLDGRAFCFLPLPIRTGLPVHVNGYFELSSNRRDIWYGGDMAGAGAARSSWNVALMADALGPCYGRVLVAVARRVGPGQQLYRLLPSLETPQPWSHLVSALYQHQLGQLPIVWTRTRAGDGRWITPTAALFSDAACAAEPLLRNLLVALGMPLACDMPPEAEARLLRGVPSATAVEPQHVRRHLANMLRAAGGDSAAVGQQITAAAAAAADADIVGGGAPQHKAASATMGGGQLPQPLAEDAGGGKLAPLTAAVAALLRYCLSDLDAYAPTPSLATVASAGGKAPIGASGSAGGQQAAQSQQQNQQQQQQQQLQKLQQELDGLPLLPLADGTLGRLQVTHQGAPASGKSARGRNSAPAPAHVYVLTHGSLELEMLAGLRNRCLAPGLPGPLVERLQRVVDLRLFNVQRLSPALLDSTLLSLLLPPSWQGAVEVEWAPTPTSPLQPQQPQQPQQQVPVQDPQSPPVLLPPPSPGPTAEWIRALWAWLANREDVLQLASWPVLPIQGGRLGTLQEKSLVLREGDWTEGVTSALLRLGCRLLDTALLEKAAGAGAGAAASPALQACVQQPSLSGVMAAIAAAKARGGGPGQVQAQSQGQALGALSRAGSNQSFTGVGLALTGVGGDRVGAGAGDAVDRGRGPLWQPPATATARPTSGPMAEPWSVRLSGLTAVERRQLRSYLLQSRWFTGSTPPLAQEGLDLLRSLPIFEVFPDPVPAASAAKAPPPPPAEPARAAAGSSASASAQQQQQQQQQQQPSQQQQQQAAAQLQHFTALDPKRHRLAPSDTDPRVLSSAFLRVDSPAEEALLERHLGVPRLSHPQLLQQHVGPRASELPRDALGTYVAGLLCRLAEVAGMWGSAANVEAQALRQALSEHPLIPTAAPSGDLRRPSELHDPRLPVLTSLLPPDSAFFPAASLTVPAAAGAVTAAGAPPSRLLDALGFLGMARAVDLRVLLTAARALQTDHAAWASASMASVTQAAAAAASASSSALSAVTDASLLSRARALLQQLELWAGQYGSSGGGAGASPGREEDPKRAWEQLSGLSWCPVLREAPEPGLPWPSMPTPLLAPPRLVRPPADAWLVGATLHILERPVGQPLQAALGWNAMPRVSVLAAQLIQLGRLHAYKPKRLTQTEAEPQLPPPPQAQTEAVADGGADAGGGANSDTESSGGSADAQLSSVPEPAKSSEGKPTTDGAADAAASTLNKALESAVHRLYDSLSAAIDGPEGDLVAMSFERPDPDSPCVWVGAGFVLPGVAVLRSEGDFRPYLWVVPEPLHQYGRLLSLMGVMDRFTAQHYASGLASLAAAAAGSPLDDDSLALALQLADCAADALAAYGRPTGHFFVPDAAAVMTPGPELFFNDAEWLDARHVQMAHGALPQTTAEALGVRSLRYAHEVEAQLTAALPCPSPGELRERLGLAAAQVADPSGASAAGASAGEAAAATFLFELLEVADALGLRGVRLVLDVRQHPAQSLLQPALAAFQGPALCVVLPEVVLSTEEVAGLLCSRAQPPSIRGRVAAYSAGLQSAFLVSEILQVVSGDTTYMFDPSGIYLGSGTGSTAGSGGGGGGAGRGRGGALSPRAKQYKHASSDLLSTFADQFAVWSFADEYDIRSPINATLLRLPLRRASPPPLGSVAAGAAGAAAIARARGESVAAADTRGLRNGGLAAATLESVEAALRQFVVHAPRSLLFLHCLHGIMVSLLRPQPAASEATASTASAGAATGSTAAGTGAATGSRAVREVLLQARVVTLDTDRLRPDFAALGAAARQRSSGPAALKALAQAFGRSLGRGGNQDNPKHYLCPLELHVMAHNALLLPTEPAAVSESPPSASASTPPPPVKPRGGGSGALGLNSVEGAVQGATVYRERWLVSSCHDLDGVPLSPAAAAASGGGGRPELVAAAAVCIGRDDQRNLFITSGLYAPVYLPATPSGSGSGGSGGGAALGRMPFLVAGHFYLLRRNGKHVVPPFARAEGAAGGGSGATPNTDAGVPGPGGPVTPPLLPQLQHRCEHNRRVLDLAATAWQNLALFFCSQDQYNGPRERLYDIFPDMAAATAANAGGIADETALYCVRQMYAAAARLPLWRLRTGRFVHLPEGCFLQPTTEGLGTAAMGFMARQLPLFDVPWITKQHLESADVHGLRTVSPAVVRPLLKNLGRRQVAGAGSAKIAWPGLTVLEATELLLFCSADLVAEVTAASTAAPAADAASGASAPAGVGSARAGGRGQAAAPAAPPMGGGGSSPGQQQAGGVGGLLDGLTSQVRNVVGELVGPALYDQLRQQALGMLGDAGAAPQTPTAPAPAPAATSAAAPAPPPPRYHAARLLDCRGLPVPTAAGSVESLGSTLLLVAPPLPALPTPAVLLPPHCGPEFVHPDCVAKMVEHFKDPQYRSSLELRLYTLDNLARHLRTALPPGWDHPMASGAALQPSPSPAQQQQRQQNQHSDPRVGPTGLGRTWDGGSGGQQGDGPSGLWLWQLWALVNGLLEAAREWQAIGGGSGSEGRLEPLHNWPLLPVLGSRAGTAVLLPVRHCRLVICLPSAPSPEAGDKGGKGAAAAAPPPSPSPSPLSAEEGPTVAAGRMPALRDLEPALPAPWNWLAPALHAIGCPLLDPRFRAAAGRHCAPHADGLPARGLAEAAAVAGSAATRGSAGAAAGAAVAALVEKMRLCNAACGGALPLRCGAEWDDATRAAVLGLLAEATPTNIDPADIIFLRRLPIYPTHGGVYTALEEGSPGPSTTSSSAADAAAAAAVETGAETTAAAAPPVVCSAELLHLVPGLDAALPASAPRRLLLPQPGASRLYTLLGVASLGAAGFLAAVALPHLERLPEEVRVMLLTHVQANWSRLRSDDALLAVLRDTPFVLVADGALKRPGELYDPDHPLFAAAFLGCPVFPRDQFATPAWLTVLRDAGMQHKVTAAAFMSAAEAVAARGAALHMTLPVEGLPEHGTSLEDPFLADGATEVPSPVAGARAKVVAAAEALVAHLAGQQGPALGGGREWWASLAKVAFVPASLGLPGSRKARQLLTRYSDAAAASDWPLVWSVLPTVAAERQVPAALGQGQLRIKSPPPLAAVVAHLRRVGADGGEEALGGWPASAGGVEDAFRTVLSYLDREGVTGQKAAQLRDVAFVPVARGTLLAPPRRLYVRLKEDFAPFAFEVPPSLASFTPLLKSLGAQDEPRAQDLVESLRALAAAVGPQPLSPNQRAAVIRLMSHVAALGGAGAANGPGGGAGGGGGTVGGSAADLTYLATARRERRLLVLSSDGRLVPAHSAVSVGEGGGVGAGAGRLLGRLDPGALTLAHPALSESVTRWLGCPRLADVAEERLDPGHPLEPVEEIQGLTLRDARALLASPAFVSACHALLRTHAPLVRGITTHGSLHEVAAVLRTAAPHLTFVRSLRTTAVLRSTGAALSPAAEASRVAFDFVEVAAVAPPPSAAAPSPPFGVISSLAPKSSPGFGAGSGLGRIFIAEPPQHLPVSWLLASVVSRVLGSPVVLPLQPLFTTPSSELQQLQPVLLPGGFDAGLETAAQAGTPGAPLLPSDAALLQLKPLRRYCAGEVVAYQRNAAAVPAAAAAAAAAARRAVATPDVPLAITSNMCYGRVAAHCAPTDSAAATGGAAGAGAASGGVHRVLVEVEPGVVQHLLSTQVFCFRSPSSDTASAATTTADPALAATATTSQPADHPTIADRSGGTSSGSGAPLPSSVLSRGGGGGPEAAAPRPSSGGGVMAPVSSQEMLAAVRDMMAAAGLPLDPAAGQLMGRVAALQEQLSEVQGQLAQAKREATSSASEAEAARGAWQCKICFSRDVDSAYTGCGHTICALCANAASTNRCPVCRKPSQSLLRLYRA